MKISKKEIRQYLYILLDLMNNPSKFTNEDDWDGWFETDIAKEIALLIYYYDLAPVDDKLLSYCLTARYCDFESIEKYVTGVWEDAIKSQIDSEIAYIEKGLF